MSIVPLILLALMARRGGAASASTAPKWPTPRHPPPTRPRRTHAAPAHAPAPAAHDAAEHATPISEAPQEAHVPPATTDPSAAKEVPAEPLSSPASAPQSDAGPPGTQKVSIATAQKIANVLGGQLKPDGLYGPHTRNTWAALAKRQKLDTTFERAAPTVAWVDSQTWAALSAAAAKRQHVVGAGLYIP